MDTIDWDLVRQMRQGFLDAKDYLPDYWRNERWLEAYDQSLAQRIRWKWLAVLKALPQAFDWLESIPVVIDWGCGTGIASRSLLEVTGHRFSSLKLFDRSAFAMQFAKHKLAGEFPDQCVDLWPKQSHEDRPYLLLVSHVLSELPADQLARLTVLAQKAAAVLWLEPGRRLESRQLSQIHDELRSSHRLLGPCLHQAACGVLKVGQDDDWCHFFAPIPREVHHSAFWREFSRQLKIDLRSLPVSYLAAVKPEFFTAESSKTVATKALILGRPTAYKGFCRWQACMETGLSAGDFPKRRSKLIYQQLADSEFPAVFEAAQLLNADEVSD